MILHFRKRFLRIGLECVFDVESVGGAFLGVIDGVILPCVSAVFLFCSRAVELA